MELKCDSEFEVGDRAIYRNADGLFTHGSIIKKVRYNARETVWIVLEGNCIFSNGPNQEKGAFVPYNKKILQPLTEND